MSTEEKSDELIEQMLSGPDKSDTIDSEIYFPDTGHNSPIHYNLRTISYSSLLTLHSCPRRYELNRLLPAPNDPDFDEDVDGHLDFGKVVGDGIQELLVNRDMNKAIFRAFCNWNDHLDSERGLKKSKTFWHAVIAIQKFQEMINGPLSSYEVATFNGKPAIELGFRVSFGNGFTYRGKLDALLIHRTKREYLPLECKTTGWKYLDEAMYGNSNQGIGYGVVIDRVAHESEGKEVNSYDVFYPVYMTSKQEWVPFRFPKGDTSRALWMQNVLLDIDDIQRYADISYFPTRGESCFSFGRQCRHYGTCHMKNELLIGDLKKIPVRLDKRKEYKFEFDIEELISAQMEKAE